MIFDNRDAGLLGRIRAHVEALSRFVSDLRVESASFQECACEHERQWRDYQARWFGGGGSA